MSKLAMLACIINMLTQVNETKNRKTNFRIDSAPREISALNTKLLPQTKFVLFSFTYCQWH